MSKLSHNSLWTAIDQLAEQYQLTPSGLARRAGLDPTIFNKSKRLAPNGRERWPSTESLAKIIDATGSSVDEFMELLETNQAPLAGISERYGFSEQPARKYLPDSVQNLWHEEEMPNLHNEGNYALKITTEKMQPQYRAGDLLIASSSQKAKAGDKVIVKTDSEDVKIGLLKALNHKMVRLEEFNDPQNELEIAAANIVFMHPILWAKQ